jgi:hypothetical protein
MKKRQTNSGYVADRKSALLPHDVLKIHAWIRSINYPIADLMHYTMALGAVWTASRFEAYSSVTVRDFNDTHKHWVITQNDGIEYLHQRVKEKTDQQFFTYRIWFDNVAPKRCYLRHLLIYVYTTQVNNGYDRGPIYANCKKALKAATERAKKPAKVPPPQKKKFGR